MTVAKPEFPFATSTNATSARQLEVLEGLRRGPGTPQEEDLVNSIPQGLVKLRLGEEMPSNGKGAGQKHKQKPSGGGTVGRGPAAGGLQGAPAPGASPMQGMMAYAYPYGQQLFYYTLPLQYPPGAGGKPLQAGGGSADASGRPLAPLVPYAFPPTPYSSPLRPAGPRRPVSNGWGGVPLGSQAPMTPAPHPPPRLEQLGGATFRGGTRSGGAARTVPLPPRKANSADGSAPPTSPAQADRPTRVSLVGSSSLSSAASSDGESLPSGRCPSNASVSGGEGAPGAADEVAVAAQQQQLSDEAAVQQPELASSGGGSSAEPDSSGGGEEEEGEGDGVTVPGGGKGEEQQQHDGPRVERQPCAFFLKTGTCAYGDRCKFEHPYELAPRVEFNSVGLPLRPSEPNCSYYMKYKTCGFGHTCKFHHPELEGAELAAGPAPAFPMHYPYAFPPMTFAYPAGAGMPGHIPPGFMGPPPTAMYAPLHASQQPPLPFPAGAMAPPAPVQLLPVSAPAEPAKAAGSAAAPIPVPQTLPLAQAQAQPEEQAQPAGSPGAGPAVPVLELVSSPPRPIMVFGGKSP